MNIDLSKLENHWFEDENGNIYDSLIEELPENIDYYTYHCIKPLIYTEPIDSFTYHPEHLHNDNSLYQAMLHFKWFYNFMFRRMKRKKYPKTFKNLITFNTTVNNEKLLIAMVLSGDYSLSEAVYIYATACERCLNVLENKYLDMGYEEYSEEWKKCNTSCIFCENESEVE